MEHHQPSRVGTLFLHACGVAGYAGYFLGNLVFLVVALPVALVLGVVPGAREGLLRWTFKTYLRALTQWYLPALRIYRIREISGRENVPSDGRAVYVANHRSRIDGPFLQAMLPPLATIIKSAYTRLPVFSSFVKYLDFIPVDQESLSSLSEAVARSREMLARGRGVLVFPEGTRAATGRLLQFGDLAFRVAMESGVPVVPIVVHTDFPFMAKRPGSIFPGRTLQTTVRILPPCRPDDGDRPGDFAANVRRLLTRELAAIDKGTPWEL